MIQILHSFFAGITFAVGVATGAILCRIATKEGRKEMVEDWRKHQDKVEDRLREYVIQSTRIANVLEAHLSKPKEGEKP